MEIPTWNVGYILSILLQSTALITEATLDELSYYSVPGVRKMSKAQLDPENNINGFLNEGHIARMEAYLHANLGLGVRIGPNFLIQNKIYHESVNLSFRPKHGVLKVGQKSTVVAGCCETSV